MTRTDEIDLDDIAWPLGRRRRVGDALRRAAARPPSLGRARALDRARRRHDRAELLKDAPASRGKRESDARTNLARA
ncbi:MAG: hypothetical protein H0X59_03390 [Chloroflexi bacterium]|nr:hypothetical protein [Chloroflexota bacterium]